MHSDDANRATEVADDPLRLFVGRGREIAAWDTAIETPSSTLIHVTGAGGSGKSALLRVFAERARAAGLRVCELDARSIEPSLPGVRLALDEAGVTAEGAGIVLLLDTYEQLAVPDYFVRTELVRRMGRHRIVIAGRDLPDPEWFANNGWGVHVVHFVLESLSEHDVRSYLERRGLSGDSCDRIRAFCKGHPLALALATEAELQAGGRAIQPGPDPDVVGALLERFLRDIPSDASRASVEVAAVVRYLREDLLAELVGPEAAARAFPWLRKLSFVERSRHGVRLHDVVRAVILADLRWRAPSRFEQLFSQARAVLAERGEQAKAGDATQITEDVLFLMRLAPEFRDQVEPFSTAQVALDTATPDDAPLIEAMLRKHEGETSVATFRRWFSRQPERFIVARTSTDPVVGFAASLRLDESAEVDPDERLRRVWRHARRMLGGDAGEVLYAPFWITRDGYHRVDDTRLALGARIARWLMEPPSLAFAYAHTTLSAADVAGFSRTGAQLVRELGFRQGETEQVVFVYDRRGLTPGQWLARSLRAMDGPATTAPSEQGAPILLERSRFEAEVRAALRNLHNASQLRSSPLLAARFLGDTQASKGARAQQLRAMIIERIEGLRATPSGALQHRALVGSYVEPAENQERAAERQGMSYSTFRRHLAAGIARLVDELWHEETGGG